MQLTLHHPNTSKARSAAIATFAAFTIFFLAYVDLYLVFDDHIFRTVPHAFWNLYNLTYITFLGVVIAILITAISLTIALTRSDATDMPNKRAIGPLIIIAALVSAIAWLLFFTVHGFGLSVLAVLSTFGIILLAVIIAFLNRRVANVPYQYTLLPTILTVLTMLAVVVLTFMSYTTLNTVAPRLFSANTIELTIVLSIMAISTLIATFFVIRAIVANLRA